jgi:transcriptional regulator with XRE-family HTH domain
MTIYEQFSKNLRRVLSTRGIKQIELAEALKIPVTTVSAWNTGRHLPELERLMMLCDYLAIPVGELVGDKRHPVNVADDDRVLLYQAEIEELCAKNDDLVKLVGKLNTELACYREAERKCSNTDILEVLKAKGVIECVFRFE